MTQATQAQSTDTVNTHGVTVLKRPETSFGIEIGDSVSVVVSSGLNNAPAALSLCIAAIHAKVVSVSEKAVQLSATTETGKPITAWFPRKALLRTGYASLTGSNAQHHMVKFAHWFRASGWTGRFVELATNATAYTA